MSSSKYTSKGKYYVTTGEFVTKLFIDNFQGDKELVNVDVIIQKTCALIEKYINDNREYYTNVGDDDKEIFISNINIHIIIDKLFHGGVEGNASEYSTVWLKFTNDVKQFVEIRMDPMYRIGNFAFSMLSKYSLVKSRFINTGEIANCFHNFLHDVLTDVNNEYNIAFQKWNVDECDECLMAVNGHCIKCYEKYHGRMNNCGNLVDELYAILQAGTNFKELGLDYESGYNPIYNFERDLEDFLVNRLRQIKGIKYVC